MRVVGAAILRDGRCLAARRGPAMSFAGRWELPGGKVEPGERPEHALARELREELGVGARVGAWLGRGEAVTRARHVVLDVFEATLLDGAPTPHEHDRLRWVGAGSLDRLDWTDADVPVLPAVRARLRAGREVVVDTDILCADWSGSSRKRAVYFARTGTGRRLECVAPPAGGWTCATLLDRARRLRDESGRPVVVGVDAVLGVPAAFTRRVGAADFLSCLAWLARAGALDQERSSRGRWSPARPFFEVPKGKGGLTRLLATAGGRPTVLRQIDLRTGAKPVFAVRGIPGTVGSGTRALWRELAPLLDARGRDFRLWPFEGDLATLAKKAKIVVGEVFPRAAYAVAMAERLPAPIRPLGKTRRAVRAAALHTLARAPWVRRAGVDLRDLAAAEAGEDDFDALVTAAALTRLVVEGRPLASGLVDPVVEGGMLGTGGVREPPNG